MITERTKKFHHLHQSGCFVIPNPWDVGSARLLEQLGFEALATTSSGFAWTCGKADNSVPLEVILEHLTRVCRSVSIPVSADFEGAFAVEADCVHNNVLAALDTGISGLSIEDSTGNVDEPLFEFSLAVDRVRAARAAIDSSGCGTLLTARTEGFITGLPDMEETARRLIAFADAGADCLYAPGIQSFDQIRTIVDVIAPKPVNVLAMSGMDSIASLADAGVRRVSVGGGLARAAYSAFLSVAEEIQSDGSFRSMHVAAQGRDINSRFTTVERDS